MKCTKDRGSERTKIGRSVIRTLKEIRAWQRGKGIVQLIEVPDRSPPLGIKRGRR
jgi:hypothetical protein